MIVPMKRLAVVCVAKASAETLDTLRNLGCVHLDLGATSSKQTQDAASECEDAQRAIRIVNKAIQDTAKSNTKKSTSILEQSANTPAEYVSSILRLDAERTQLQDEIEKLRTIVRTYEPFGDFDPQLVRKLQAEGIDLNSVCSLPEILPDERLSTTKARLTDKLNRITEIQNTLVNYADRIQEIIAYYPALQDKLDFEAARDSLATQGAVAWVEGWCPETAVEKLRTTAQTNNWGILLRDPTADETPPTLIKPPKLFRPVVALFQGLGIAPAYTEADVSVPFMAYFALFFAMLVGDGAYGSIFGLITLYSWFKTRPTRNTKRSATTRSWLILMSVFSLATIAWGTLSNTWFGTGIPACANWPTVTWLADTSYKNMMLLCFTIGVSHLMLARIWNGIVKSNDTTCLAEFGWAGVLLTMYLVTNSIVGIFPAFPNWGYWVGGISIILVFGFTVKPCELKTRGIELGMLPLNIMSALGDIISYVRLFAVGLASVQVAANFNDMAIGLLSKSDVMWVKPVLAIAMVAVLVVGHALNLAMAGLSILVHAVRLNTLEFSNHKGISWAGYAFKPFIKRQ